MQEHFTVPQLPARQPLPHAQTWNKRQHASKARVQANSFCSSLCAVCTWAKQKVCVDKWQYLCSLCAIPTKYPEYQCASTCTCEVLWGFCMSSPETLYASPQSASPVGWGWDSTEASLVAPAPPPLQESPRAWEEPHLTLGAESRPRPSGESNHVSTLAGYHPPQTTSGQTTRRENDKTIR